MTRILEKVIPLVAHPDAAFLSRVEDEMVKLIIKHGPNVSTAHIQIHNRSVFLCVNVCMHVHMYVCTYVYVHA